MARLIAGNKKRPQRTSSRTRRLTIRDRLSRLTYRGAINLLGPDGEELMRQGAKHDLTVSEHARWLGDSLRVQVPDYSLVRGFATVSMLEMTARNRGLLVTCDAHESVCEHMAAALSLVLEDKLLLGLSRMPDPDLPLELLTDAELVDRAIADRRQRAASEQMLVQSADGKGPWTDYAVTSRASGKSYRVALRGWNPGESYCSCPDFRTNHLGVCKHILHVAAKVRRRFPAKALERPYQRRNVSIRLDYGPQIGLRVNLPARLDSVLEPLLAPWADRATDDVTAVMKLIRALERRQVPVHVYPDAEEFIQHRLMQASLSERAAEIRRDPASHPLRTELLRVPLLPYQLDGIAFAVGAGRALLADDMGLGKTIQGIGVAELYAQLAGISNVLVVTPATLKGQWRSEIMRFSHRDCRIVTGSAAERAQQYGDSEFFKICNYEQVMRDHPLIASCRWDLIILDEGQRIKNWEGKTAQVIKSLSSPFALVLSGTPLENRLEELYSVVSFIDDRRLGPAYRFLHRHRNVDEKGRILGYKNLDELRERLKPVLLRRTRASVAQDLPERSTEVVRIRPTEEQLAMSEDNVKSAARIAAKPYLTEMDVLRIQKLLLAARMAANSTFLVNKEPPGFSSKLKRLAELLEQMAGESERNIIVFSEWTSMLDLVEPILTANQLGFVRLDGSVPQKHRAAIVAEFQESPQCRTILLSNAGATGLNLQSANTVINLDLPWNPAVLEQRIARAHRMGQRQQVQVYLMVTEDTIEERMLDTLSAKHDLALAALDVDSSASEVELRSGIEELKRRMERLLGKMPPAPVDASQEAEVLAVNTDHQQRRERVASAGGELLGAALHLVGELVGNGDSPPPPSTQVDQIRLGLESCMQIDSLGRRQLQLTFPDDQSIQQLATTLARLLVPPTT